MKCFADYSILLTIVVCLRSTFTIFIIISVYECIKILKFYNMVFSYTECNSLSNMSITVPVAVASGDSAKMTCTYDLESDPLYTVKWYKGRQEFFRYVPKELPHTRVFPWPGINVDVSVIHILQT